MSIYTDILNADGGIFISGATGSGKSTVISVQETHDDYKADTLKCIEDDIEWYQNKHE